MIRKVLMAGVAGAVALGGLAALGGTASAAKPTITAATAANFTCDMTAKVKLSPGLKNNWKASEHNGDNVPVGDTETNAGVIAIPDTTFSSGISPVISAKAKTGTCSGTITDATGTYPVTGLKIGLAAGTPAVDVPPVNEPGTCDGLLAGSGVGDTPATYNSDVKVKASGAKVTNFGINGSTITPAGLGFALANGTLSGSVAGGNSKATANIDATTANAVTSAPATSTTPTPVGALAIPNSICEASLKLNAVPSKTKLKKPKGLKKIGIGPDVISASPSTICVRLGSTCP